MDCVFIINSNVELVDALKEVFTSEGYKTFGFHVHDLKRNPSSLKKLLEKHKPKLVIFDVAIPYRENYEFFKLVKENFSDGSKIVLTTTNKAALEALVGKTYAIEIISKPFDIEDLLNMAKPQQRLLLTPDPEKAINS